MKIKYSLNYLLQFTLIFTVVYVIINPVLAGTPNTQSNYFLNSLQNIFLDLPIFVTLLTLLLFRYLDKNQQQKLYKEIINNQILITNKLLTLDRVEKEVNTLNNIKSEITKLNKNNQEIIESQSLLLESFNKSQSNQSAKQDLLISNMGFSSEHSSYSALEQSDTYENSSVVYATNDPQFIEIYNRDKNHLLGKEVATVAETKESMENRLAGISEAVFLLNTNKGKYWIVEEDNNYYLAPHAKINIEEHNLTTLQNLFDCTNFTPEYSDFKLVKPAKVSKLSSETWQLEEKGKLDFY